MKSLMINNIQNGQRIDKIIKKLFPRLPTNSLYKAFRKKDIKVNKACVKETYIVSVGDLVEIYIIDSILNGEVNKNELLKLDKLDKLDIVYEDNNIIVINKKQGISVHEDEGESTGNTLIGLVQLYLKEKIEYDEKTSKFHPSLCHRLDRNTGGLVLIAKNKEAYDILLKKIKEKEVKKYYLCYVKGFLKKKSDTMKAYLIKDQKKSRVYISDNSGKGKQTIITSYRVLQEFSTKQKEYDLSFVEVELITGKTHQIRAHFAHIGHPILGDGKYGENVINRKYKTKYQVLWAYKIKFDFKESKNNNNNILSYLNKKIFEVKPNFDNIIL